MKELFYEESAKIQNEKTAKTKYYIFNIFSIFSYCMIFFGIIIIFITPFDGNVVLTLIIAIFPTAIFLTCGIILGKIKNRFYVDYDYTFVTGSIRIAKVIKNVKRKQVMVFDTTNIEKLGKYNSETYVNYEKFPKIKKKLLTLNDVPAEGKDFYYLVVNLNDEKNLLVFECTELFMANVLKYSNKMILEKDFK